MPRIHLIRHGKAAAGFDADLDPGLDEVGRAQAGAAAETMAPFGPMTLLTSPLKRARETAEPLARHWDMVPEVAPEVTEIPLGGNDLSLRHASLDSVMAGGWNVAAPELNAWRRSVVDYLLALRNDSVVFSHFIAINVAVGQARDDDRVVVFRPDNGSITSFETDGRKLRLVTLGREAATDVRSG